MKRLRLILWAVAGGACIATAVGPACSRGANRPQLPVAQHYAKLPDKFNQILQQTLDKARSHGNDPVDVRKLARLYQANRLYREARVCYHIIEASAGKLSARDHYYLANIDQDENDLVGAQKQLRVVLQMEPGYVPARMALADALFKSGNEEKAAKEYAAILAIEVNQPQASLGMARIEMQRGDEEAAVARLEELMAAHPESTPAAALFAQILERRGDSDRAIAMRQMSQQKPEPPLPDPWLSSLLADCYDIQRLSITFEEYFKTGKMGEAVPLLDRLSELDPDGPVTKMFAGFSHAKALQHITAVREYYEALGKGGDPEKICPYLVQSLLELGKVSEAASLLAGIYAKMPDSSPISKAYADVAIRQGDEKLARVLLEKILQKEPYLQPQNMSLAKILWASGARDEAAKCLVRVASVYSNDVGSRGLLGEYYLGKGDPVTAVKYLEQANAVVSDKTPVRAGLAALLGTAYFQCGNAEAERGQLAEAANWFDKSTRIAPADINGYAGLANAAVQLKQFPRATEALSKMVSLQPDNPTIYLSLGDVLFQDGKGDEARRKWEKALKLSAEGDTELRGALNDRLSGRISTETFK